MHRAPGSGRRTQGLLGGRSEQVVRRVLRAALVELARSGYAGFRMDAVARLAEVNRTTLYRRWPSRRALVGAVAARMSASLRDVPLPDTGSLERDLVEAFGRRFAVGRKADGRAWARLLAERHHREVQAIIGSAVTERRAAWQSMVGRAIDRGELPAATDPQLVLDFVRAIVDARTSPDRLDAAGLTTAVRTVLAGARAGVLIGRTPRRSAQRLAQQRARR